MTDTVAPCSNEDCAFDQNGTCVEGQDPSSCPFRSGRPMIAATPIGADDTSRSADSDGDAETDPATEDDALELDSGLRLEAADCVAIRLATRSRLVSILAPKNAGKTSLVAGLYELFLEGRATGAQFISSDTLLDFERICHLSRAESGQTKSDMERTPRGQGLKFYHLELATSGTETAVLLGDRPGEQVREAGNGPQAAAPLLELRSADVVLYLIDGALLSDPEQRHVPQAQAEAVLESVIAAKHLSHRPPIVFVLTKADLCENGSAEMFDRIFVALSDRFRPNFGVIERVETAANTDETVDGIARGHGMNQLLDIILGAAGTVQTEVREQSEPQRQFESFGRWRAEA